MTLGIMLNWSLIIIGATFLCRVINDNISGLANAILIGVVLLVAYVAGYGAWRQDHKEESSK